MRKLFSKLLQPYRRLRDKRLAKLREPYLAKIQELLGDNCSIISSNCFAGRIMQDLNMKYNSPTEGLYFWAPDYVEFLSDLPRYLKSDIKFVDHSKHSLGDERRKNWSHWYPIGVLDEKVEIHFLHYYTKEEAEEKWHRRAARVNFDNLLIIGMDQNYGSKDVAEAFDKLPYKKKIFFSRFPLKLESNEYMPDFADSESVGDPYKLGHIFYRHLIDHFFK